MSEQGKSIYITEVKLSPDELTKILMGLPDWQLVEIFTEVLSNTHKWVTESIVQNQIEGGAEFDFRELSQLKVTKIN